MRKEKIDLAVVKTDLEVAQFTLDETKRIMEKYRRFRRVDAPNGSLSKAYKRLVKVCAKKRN